MGMHFGILAADTSWPAFQGKLHRIGKFHPAGPSRDLEQIRNQKNNFFLLIAGEYAGKAYVVDESFMLSMSYPDFIVELSADAGCRIVGCGAETVSGSFDFNFAENGTLKRLYHQCNMSISKPFELGEPLACEQTIPYYHLDGEGLMAALRELGFDYDAFYERGEHSCYFFDPDDVRLKEYEFGVFGKQILDHKEQYQWPAGKAPQPQVVFRGFMQRPSGFWGWVRWLFGGR